MAHSTGEAKGSLIGDRYTLMGESPLTSLIAWVAKPGQRRSVESWGFREVTPTTSCDLHSKSADGADVHSLLGPTGPQTPPNYCQRHCEPFHLFQQFSRITTESYDCLDHLRSVSRFSSLNQIKLWGLAQ